MPLSQEALAYKNKFIEIYTTNIKREGSEKLLEYLQSKNCDFFSAPASTRFHNSFEGGLCEHSINVYECLKSYLESDRVKNGFGLSFSDESIAIVALLHDVCKTNTYVVSTRNVKNDKTGAWEKVPYYDYNDTLPYGHGEKSVYIVSGFMKLTRDEAMAIRWHMGFSMGEDTRLVGNALREYPLAQALNIADAEATNFIEERRNKSK
ncbi:MAG: HD domain-containing protein [Oscillospiraceae bacterium]|nr:HD domain-containing protein [Oscillospiraceae bacterium]